MDGVILLQAGSGTVINLAFSVLTGALCTRLLLRRAAPCGVDVVLPQLARVERAAAVSGLLGSAASLWAAAATMGGVALGEAVEMVGPMLGTAYGHAGLLGFGSLALLAALLLSGRRGSASLLFAALLLLVFSLARVSVSHAAEDGLLSLGVLVEWSHLVTVALWVGLVGLTGMLVLPRVHAGWPRAGQLGRYLDRVSACAAGALAVILASGLYNAWHRLGSLEHLSGNVYGNALVVKLGLVALAVALGGYNKFTGFPALAASLEGRGRVLWVLRVELAILFGAMVAASVLTSSQPPASWS